jgi:hypothetical protein
MLCVVLPAFLSARATGLRAKAANILRELRVGAHEQRRCAAKNRTISVQFNAARHHLYVVFPQAGAGAMSAFVGAVIARFNAIDVFLLWHTFPFSLGKA